MFTKESSLCSDNERGSSSGSLVLIGKLKVSVVSISTDSASSVNIGAWFNERFGSLGAASALSPTLSPSLSIHS